MQLARLEASTIARVTFGEPMNHRLQTVLYHKKLKSQEEKRKMNKYLVYALKLTVLGIAAFLIGYVVFVFVNL